MPRFVATGVDVHARQPFTGSPNATSPVLRAGPTIDFSHYFSINPPLFDEVYQPTFLVVNILETGAMHGAAIGGGYEKVASAYHLSARNAADLSNISIFNPTISNNGDPVYTGTEIWLRIDHSTSFTDGGIVTPAPTGSVNSNAYWDWVQLIPGVIGEGVGSEFFPGPPAVNIFQPPPLVSGISQASILAGDSATLTVSPLYNPAAMCALSVPEFVPLANEILFEESNLPSILFSNTTPGLDEDDIAYALPTIESGENSYSWTYTPSNTYQGKGWINLFLIPFTRPTATDASGGWSIGIPFGDALGWSS